MIYTKIKPNLATTQIQSKILKNILLYFWLLLEPCIGIWRFLLTFGQILAIENLKTVHGFSTVNYLI
jgi:hypothetical protein